MTTRISEYISKNLNKNILVADIKSFVGESSTQPPTKELIESSSEIWLDGSYDPIYIDQDPYKQAINNVKQLNTNVKVLTGDFNYYYQPISDVRYCPFWFLKVYPVRSFKPKSIRTFKFSCLNREPKPHRLINFCLFLKSEYISDSCISFWGKHMYNTNLTEVENQKILKRMVSKCNDAYITEIFNQVVKELPYHPYEPNYQGENDHEIMHPAYSDTYINVVTETSCDFSGIYGHSDAPIITEKTIKPLLARQMFLMSADSLVVDFLRDMGIDMFDDIIDHSYDTIRGFKEKTYAIHAELCRLNKLDLPSIFANNRLRLENNYKRLFDKKFLMTITKQLWT